MFSEVEGVCGDNLRIYIYNIYLHISYISSRLVTSFLSSKSDIASFIHCILWLLLYLSLPSFIYDLHSSLLFVFTHFLLPLPLLLVTFFDPYHHLIANANAIFICPKRA